MTPTQLDLIALDADDTLWHNESIFSMTEEKFMQLLAAYHSPELIQHKLYEIELRNLHNFGYGVKGFMLSMIETAIELTDGQVSGAVIQQILDFGKAMVHAPVELLDHVAEVVPRLAASHTLMLLTKGDLFDQESKLARSGLAEYFRYVEIVSDKTTTSYRALLQRYQVDPLRFLMVGNSLRSDILPVTALGGWAVYIPYHLTWAHETVADHDPQHQHYVELEHIGLLPDLIERLGDKSA
ncbi:MAG TPA: HAD family hydrolase [Roseiflexaceae bacterium]|nr:HAD family hydrolase [Roseiflexaceae bacterium]